ncbi:MAG: enoyl-CoA hydratase/isomerase family protein [Gammaproteobacteria bacterium]
MAFDFLKVHNEQAVGWIEYNRPPRNAFTFEMNGEVTAAVEAHVADPGVRVIVIGSALDDYFSVGADVQIFDGISREGIIALATQVHDLARTLRRSPKPLLAAIHGTAVGGGLEMTLHCDIRFAAEDARLGQPEVNINFIPPIGTTQSLVRLLGRPRALRYLYEGTLVSAREAQAMGLVDGLFPPRRLREEVQDYAAALAAKPPEALAAIRRTITEGMELPFEEALKLEFDAVVELAGTENFAEGVRAFLEKRKPVWR